MIRGTCSLRIGLEWDKRELKYHGCFFMYLNIYLNGQAFRIVTVKLRLCLKSDLSALTRRLAHALNLKDYEQSRREELTNRAINKYAPKKWTPREARTWHQLQTYKQSKTNDHLYPKRAYTLYL